MRHCTLLPLLSPLLLATGCRTLLGIDDGVVAALDGGTDARPDDAALEDATIDTAIDAAIDAPPAWWDPTYAWRHRIDFSTTGLAVPLPDMPLFLVPGGHVLVPLEKTYMAAWDGVPRRWRKVIDPTSA